ncbi:MAG: threonine synthase, partial [Eubacteriales bacterium]|nr:threonine synthase [Eubacteriales bacterium]
ALAAELGSAGKILSSANSINWGRLLPQIVYYCSAYVDLLQREKIEPGAPVNFVVPTGNFGNILAAWYASQMGLPVHRLICASNRNKILSDFIRTGRYDSRREFHVTNSPSMDILISSNLERLLFELCGRNSETVREWMNDLREQGAYEIDQESLKKLQMLFVGGYCDEKGTLRMIRDVYDRTDHLIDTHTAVGFNVYSRYANRSNDRTPTVFVSTASPLKFAGAVSDAVFGNGYSRGRGEMVLIEELAVEGGFEIPETLRDLAQRPVLHERQIRPDQMLPAVREYLLPEEPELN